MVVDLQRIAKRSRDWSVGYCYGFLAGAIAGLLFVACNFYLVWLFLTRVFK